MKNTLYALALTLLVAGTSVAQDDSKVKDKAAKKVAKAEKKGSSSPEERSETRR